jgi:hypothetical protein
MSRTVYTLPQPNGPAVTVVTATDGTPDPGAYTVYLDAVGVASLTAQLLAVDAPVRVVEHRGALLLVHRFSETNEAVPVETVDGLTVWDFGTVGLPWETVAHEPVTARAEHVLVAPALHEGRAEVHAAVRGQDDDGSLDARAWLVLSAREAHELAADLIAAADEAERLADQARPAQG